MMIKYRHFLLMILIIFFSFLVACSDPEDYGYYAEETHNYQELLEADATGKKVKNVILIIGDGMGANQVEVTRMLENRKLDLDKMEYKSMMSTYCLNNEVTDSAASATALAAGYKTNYEVVGRNPEGEDLQTIFDAAHDEGFKTGLLTSKHLYDATPAAFSAHSDNRYDGNTKIVSDQVASNIDIMMGGGQGPYTAHESTLVENGYEVIKRELGFIDLKSRLEDSQSDRIFGLFSTSGVIEEGDKIPTLAEMTKKSIDILSKSEKGFLLVVEEGQIDNYADSNNIRGMVKRVVELDKTLRVALNFARSNQETLVIVLADHETGGLEIKEGTPDNSWFTSDYHTPVDVPVYSFGLHSYVFDKKTIDNTDIPKIIARLMGLETFANIGER